ncbi:hypothetical protein OC845_004366 [Tilletia horrida]|nr:hypothetical protein OC845_004366 [Tilletia horrida]
MARSSTYTFSSSSSSSSTAAESSSSSSAMAMASSSTSSSRRRTRPANQHSKPQRRTFFSPSTLRAAASLTLVALGLACAPTLALAASPAGSFPEIDFDALGALGVVGNFVGLEIYNSSLVVEPSPVANGSSLVSRAPNGTLTTLGSTNPNASINAVTIGGPDSGNGQLVYVAGNFSQVGNITTRSVAAYDPSSQSWTDLDGGLDGDVYALYYSGEHQALLAGGNFRTPVSANTASEQAPYHGSVALWNEQTGAWQPVNFGGLNGTVFSITPGSTNSNFVRFAGNFLAIYGSGQNATSDTPRSPSSMTRVLSPYSLAMARVSGGPPSQSPDYNNPLQILCPQGADGPGNSYHFAAGSRGLLTVETYRLLDVAAIRLGNSLTENHGLRSFSVVALPDNEVLELLYKDPATGANVTCSDDCILSNRASLPYQDFLISPAQGGAKLLTGVQIRVNSFYGVGAGLHILELLSDGAWTYANNALNRGRCSSPVPGVNGTRSLTHHTGIWDFTTVNGDLNTQLPVLEFTDSVSNLAEDISDNTSVQFNIDIPVDGNYTGYISIPGCAADGSCARRVTSLVTVYPEPDRSISVQTYVNQAVEQTTQVKIFDGQIIGTNANAIEGASQFMPQVVLSIAPNATAPAGQSEFTIVADKLSFQLRNSNETTPMVGPGLAFGLLEFDVFNSSAALPKDVNTTLTRTVGLSGGLPSVGANGTGLNAREAAKLDESFNAALASLSSAAAKVAARKEEAHGERQLQARQALSSSSASATQTRAGALPTGTAGSTSFQAYALPVVLPSFQNTTQTSLDTFATTLYEAGLNGAFNFSNSALGSPAQVVRAVADVAGFTFVGGNFTSTAPLTNSSGFANLVGYNVSTGGRNITRLTGGGVNGRVLALAGDGQTLYVGGDFTGLADGSNSGVKYFGKYDVVENQWLSTGASLDGPVTSLTVLPNSTLLLTGAFTAANGTNGNGGFAMYDTSSGSWIQEDGLVSGTVNAAAAYVDDSNGQNQTTTYLVGPITAVSDMSVPGAATIEPANTTNSFPTINALNFAFLRDEPASSNQAPNVVSMNGVMLFNGTIALKNGTLVAPNGTVIYNPGRSAAGGRHSSSSTAAATKGNKRDSTVRRLASAIARRAVADLEAQDAAEAKRGLRSLQGRATSAASAINPEILMSPNGTNEIYASAFWQRSDGTFLQIVGGEFTTSGNVVNLGAYDPDTHSLAAFPAIPAALATLTTVRALLVVNNQVFVGGDGGLVSYDFVKGAWDNTTTPLSSDAQNPLVVRTITHRPDSSEIYVGGAFDNAGTLPCASVCMWDTSALRWNPLGTSLDGDIAVLDFAGNKGANLIAAGNLQVSGVSTPLASYDSTQNAWAALGAIGQGDGLAPGAATAMSVDNLQLNSIFVAGRTQDGTSAYLSKWDGGRYVALGQDEIQPATGIQQLTFVPILRAHGGNSILENNRLLVVSGILELSSFGNISSAFFDGSSWQPFLLGAGSEGSRGIVRAVVRATEILKFSNLKRLAAGLVILISIAIGLGLVFLLTLLGLLWAMARRNKNRAVDTPLSAQHDYPGATSDEYGGRPSSLLATLNAATENVMGAGAGAGAAGAGAGAYAAQPGAPPSSGGHGSHHFAQAAGVAGVGAAGLAGAAAAATSSGHARGDSAAYGTVENSDETGGPSTAYHSEGAQTGRSGASQYFTDDENAGSMAAAGGVAAGGGAAAAAAAAGVQQGIAARARYSFEAGHESELSMHAGDQITILDDLDEHWWLARDANGREGVVPSTYVL